MAEDWQGEDVGGRDDEDDVLNEQQTVQQPGVPFRGPPARVAGSLVDGRTRGVVLGQMFTPKRKYDADEEPRLPIPQQITSNGEYLPVPQTPEQRKVAALTQELADSRARKLGTSRRDFLRTSAGMATVMFAMNQIYGCGDDDGGGGGQFDVCEGDTFDPERAAELFDQSFFIMDVQTHHADAEQIVSAGLSRFASFLRFIDLEHCDRSDDECIVRDLISQEHYIKEMFLESETDVAVISGIPPNSLILPNVLMADTRDRVNELAGSQRMLAQMLCEPTLPEGTPGRTTIFDIQRNVDELGSVALKAYPGANSFFLDDESIAYPMYEKALEAGITTVAVHKGLPGIFGPMEVEHVQTIDLPKAARDWPEINFVVYHSGYFPSRESARRLPDGTLVPQGVEQFATLMEQNPDLTNIYAEIGSTFAQTNTTSEGGEFMGRLLKAVGPDRICWGTDSIWWGSPQWQICAMKAFQIPERLQQEKGYPALTDDDKAKIFGLTNARLYGVDPNAARSGVDKDQLTVARAEYLDMTGPAPAAQPHGPRTRREFLRLAAKEEMYDKARRGV